MKTILVAKYVYNDDDFDNDQAYICSTILSESSFKMYWSKSTIFEQVNVSCFYPVTSIGVQFPSFVSSLFTTFSVITWFGTHMDFLI